MGDDSSGTGKCKRNGWCCHIFCPLDVENGGSWQQRRPLLENLIRVLGLMRHSAGLTAAERLWSGSWSWNPCAGWEGLQTHTGTRVWTCLVLSWCSCVWTCVKLGLRAGDTAHPYLCSRPPHPSPPAARLHSWYLLWTGGLCRLPTKHTHVTHTSKNTWLVCVSAASDCPQRRMESVPDVASLVCGCQGNLKFK